MEFDYQTDCSGRKRSDSLETVADCSIQVFVELVLDSGLPSSTTMEHQVSASHFDCCSQAAAFLGSILAPAAGLVLAGSMRAIG